MYIIIKKSRMYLGGKGYAGPTCQHANTKPGHIYKHKSTAERAAERLSDANPVGFEVLPFFKERRK